METATTTTAGWIVLGLVFGFLILGSAIAAVIRLRQMRMAVAKPEEANKIEKSLIQSRLPYWFIVIFGVSMFLVGFGNETEANSSPMLFYGALTTLAGIIGLMYRKRRLDQIEQGITPAGIPLSRKLIASAGIIALCVGYFTTDPEQISSIIIGLGSIVAIISVFWHKKN